QPLRAETVHQAQIMQAVLVEIRLDDAYEHVHAHWQTSGAGQELIGLHLFFGDDDVVDTGDTAMGALLQLNGDTLRESFRIDLTVSTLDQELCPLPQLARGLAGPRVLDHRPTLWAGSIAGHTPLAQRQGIGDDDVRSERDIGWVAGQGTVEFRLG